MGDSKQVGVADSPAAPPSWNSSGRRVVGLYLGLVLLPVAAVALLLWKMYGSPDHRSTAGTQLAPAHQLATTLLAITAVVGLCLAAGSVARRLGQPAVIGEITAGILLGPSVLGAALPGGQSWLLPPGAVEQIGVLAQLGAVLFVFLAGLELRPEALRGQGHLTAVISHVSIAVPLLAGVLLAFPTHGRLAPEGVSLGPYALFLGAAMSVTALPVMARILVETGWWRSPLATVAMTCAMVDDITAWCLLALLVALATAGGMSAVAATVLSGLLLAGCLVLVVRPLLRRVVDSESPAAVPLVLAGLLVTAAAAEWAGVHAIFGAFLFGLVFPGDSPLGRRTHTTLHGLTTILLLPLFFAYNGLRTEIGLLGPDPELWAWCGVILVVAVLGKLVGTTVTARLVGADRRTALRLGALMNARGLTELIVLNVGLDLGVISPTLFTMLVLMALVSTAMTAPILRHGGDPEARQPTEPEPTVVVSAR